MGGRGVRTSRVGCLHSSGLLCNGDTDGLRADLHEAAGDPPTPHGRYVSLPADGSRREQGAGLSPALPPELLRPNATTEVVLPPDRTRTSSQLTAVSTKKRHVRHTPHDQRHPKQPNGAHREPGEVIARTSSTCTSRKSSSRPCFRLLPTVKNSTGDNHQVLLVFGHKAPKATLEFYGRTVPCDIARSVDPRTDHVTIDIPRECLGEPGWVRISLMARAYVHDPAETIAWDYALNKGSRLRTGADGFSHPSTRRDEIRGRQRG